MDYKHLCDQVIELAKETGEFFLSEIHQVAQADIEEKGLHNFVSYVDKTAEARLVKRLSELLPEAGFIAEEGTASYRGKVFDWVIDPLDGTTNFLHHVPLYSISIALLEKGKTVLGVVHEPNLNECFYAYHGGGAFMNGEPIHVTQQHELKNSLFATGFPYMDYGKMKQYMQLFEWFAQNTSGVRRLGSAAVDLVYTACGRFEGFYEYGLQPWDVAAGAYIVQQAGGTVTDFEGKDNFVFGGEMLATNTVLHPELLTHFQKHFASF